MPRWPLLASIAALSASSLVISVAHAQELRLGPYLQDVTPTSARVLWETSAGEESRVEWGPTDALGDTVMGTAVATEGTARLHDAALTGLEPATRYHYRVHTGPATSEVFAFSTAPARDGDVTFRLVAMSDMQIDDANPDIYRQIIHEGILALLRSEGHATPDDGLSFVLVPGDLVDDGNVYDSWRTEFFEPGADLMALVPFYPALGNHENNSPHYFTYFHMPEAGAEADPDRFWAMDWANVRVIGLDSNQGLLAGPQEEFLEARLVEACADEATDFVFVALHHAHQSELWPPGEIRLATQVVARMNRFTTDCGKPSVHFYGHTHGYSRGASRDASHLWVNVASAGGNLDYWGEYQQPDYDDVSVSQDEYGFVIVEVTGGDDPSFHMRRIGRGDEMRPVDNELRDEIVVRRYGSSPERPTPSSPRGAVALSCDTLVASPFVDPDAGDLHGATQWQVARSCDGFDAPIIDRLRAHENWYAGEDTQAGDDLTDEPIAEAEPGAYLCWRARYRDRGLVWSEWSEPVAFTLSAEGAESCDDPSPLSPPSPDAGTEPDVAGDCACRATAAGSRSIGWGWLVLLAGLVIRLRRQGR